MDFDVDKRKLLETTVEMIHENISGVVGIYLFGSFVKGVETSESDLDIAFLCNHSTDAVMRWDLAQKIAYRIRRDVDLIDLAEVSTVFRFQIISTGKRIDCRDESRCTLFEDLCYSMYLRFQEERLPILQDIQQGKWDL